MGFFDELPAAEPEPPRRHHHWEPPEAGFPGIVSIDTIQLARSEHVGVAITGLSAYPAGFEIFLTTRIRPGARVGQSDGPAEPMDLVMAARRSLRFGLQLSDGSKVIGERGGPARRDDAEPTGPILRPFMGGGGRHSHFSRWWAWPLPPSGPLEFVCEWPVFGIPETRASIDAQLILDAAGHSIQLWPEDEG